jgi:NADPH-dependent ferric siderophore reductase
VQHLITADENSLPELELMLAALPLCAVGRVFIEVPEAEDIGMVSGPPCMTVTALVGTGQGVLRAT